VWAWLNSIAHGDHDQIRAAANVDAPQGVQGLQSVVAKAVRRGYEIVHPLTDEPWGVRRFLVRDPDGNVINIVSHRDE
jgi:uncharacterized glyoxalase superfamily protein PhnB